MKQPWWQSVKVVIFLVVFLALTGGLLALILAGRLDAEPGLIGSYVTGVVTLAAALFVGRGLGEIGLGLGTRLPPGFFECCDADDDDEGPPEPPEPAPPAPPAPPTKAEA